MRCFQLLTRWLGAPSGLRFEFQRVNGTKFDEAGVLNHIATEGKTSAWTNPHAAGRVVARKSSSDDGSADFFVHGPTQPLPGNKFNYTGNRANQWMSVDLGPQRKLAVNHYALRTDNHDDHKPRNWKLQGADADDGPWTTLRNHDDDGSLEATKHSTAAWPVEGAAYFRRFRILQHGPSSSGKQYLMCFGIELYGHLIEDSGGEEKQHGSEWRRLGTIEIPGTSAKFVDVPTPCSGIHELKLAVKKQGYYSYHGMAPPRMRNTYLGDDNGVSLCSNSSSTYVSNGVTSEDLASFGGFDAGDNLLFVFNADSRELTCSVNGTAVRRFGQVPAGWRFALSGSGGHGTVEAQYRSAEPQATVGTAAQRHGEHIEGAQLEEVLRQLDLVPFGETVLHCGFEPCLHLLQSLGHDAWHYIGGLTLRKLLGAGCRSKDDVDALSADMIATFAEAEAAEVMRLSLGPGSRDMSDEALHALAGAGCRTKEDLLNRVDNPRSSGIQVATIDDVLAEESKRLGAEEATVLGVLAMAKAHLPELGAMNETFEKLAWCRPARGKVAIMTPSELTLLTEAVVAANRCSSAWTKTAVAPPKMLEAGPISVTAGEQGTELQHDKRESGVAQAMCRLSQVGSDYFEVLVIDGGEQNIVCVGVAPDNYNSSTRHRVPQPGWEAGSVGYHADDGGLFVEDGSAAAAVRLAGDHHRTFGTGDVVGCGVIFGTQSHRIFFTLNGQATGMVAAIDAGRPLNACVGLRHGAKVVLNTGQLAFQFKLAHEQFVKNSSLMLTTAIGGSEEARKACQEGGGVPLVLGWVDRYSDNPSACRTATRLLTILLHGAYAKQEWAQERVQALLERFGLEEGDVSAEGIRALLAAQLTKQGAEELIASGVEAAAARGLNEADFAALSTAQERGWSAQTEILTAELTAAKDEALFRRNPLLKQQTVATLSGVVSAEVANFTLRCSLGSSSEQTIGNDTLRALARDANCRTKDDVVWLSPAAIATLPHDIGQAVQLYAELEQPKQLEALRESLDASAQEEQAAAALDLSNAKPAQFQHEYGLKLEACRSGVVVVMASFGSNGDSDQYLGLVRAGETNVEYSAVRDNGWCIRRSEQGARLSGKGGAKESKRAPDAWRLGRDGRHSEVTMLFDRAKREASFWRGFTVEGEPATVISNLPDEDLAPFVGKYNNRVVVKELRWSGVSDSAEDSGQRITWDPQCLETCSGATLEDDNKTFKGNNEYQPMLATAEFSTGRRSWTVRGTQWTHAKTGIAVREVDRSRCPGQDSTARVFGQDSQKHDFQKSIPGLTDAAVLTLTLDCDAGTFAVAVDGVPKPELTFSDGITGKTWIPVAGCASGDSSVTIEESVSEETLRALAAAGCRSKDDVDALSADKIATFAVAAAAEVMRFSLGPGSEAMSDASLHALAGAGCRTKEEVLELDVSATAAFATDVAQYLAKLLRPLICVPDGIPCPYAGKPFSQGGVLYSIATEQGKKAWSNPHIDGKVVAAMSSIGDSGTNDNGHPHKFVGRSDDGYCYTSNERNQWFCVDLGEGRTVVPTYFCLRNDQAGSYPLRNWTLQGKTAENDADWVDIQRYSNDETLARVAYSVGAWPIEGEARAFRHFRIHQHGDNGNGSGHLMCCGFELYGQLTMEDMEGGGETGGQTRGVDNHTLVALTQAGCRTKSDVVAMSARAIASLPGEAPEQVAEYLLRGPLGDASKGVVGAKTLVALLGAGCRTKPDVFALSATVIADLPDEAPEEVAEYLLRKPLGDGTKGIVSAQALVALLCADCRTKADVMALSVDAAKALSESAPADVCAQLTEYMARELLTRWLGERLTEWQTGVHGKGATVALKSDGRRGVSTMAEASLVQRDWARGNGRGTKVKRKSDGRRGVSTMNRDSDGEIKIKFDDDGSESRYINTRHVWVVVGSGDVNIKIRFNDDSSVSGLINAKDVWVVDGSLPPEKVDEAMQQLDLIPFGEAVLQCGFDPCSLLLESLGIDAQRFVGGAALVALLEAGCKDKDGVLALVRAQVVALPQEARLQITMYLGWQLVAKWLMKHGGASATSQAGCRTAVGAGLSRFDGNYVADGAKNGKACYRKEGGGKETMNYSDGYWYMCENHSGSWYRVACTADRPPEDGWQVASKGSSPAPTLRYQTEVVVGDAQLEAAIQQLDLVSFGEASLQCGFEPCLRLLKSLGSDAQQYVGGATLAALLEAGCKDKDGVLGLAKGQVATLPEVASAETAAYLGRQVLAAWLTASSGEAGLDAAVQQLDLVPFGETVLHCGFEPCLHLLQSLGRDAWHYIGGTTLRTLLDAGCRSKDDVDALSAGVVASLPVAIAARLMRLSLGPGSEAMSDETLHALAGAGCRTKEDVLGLDVAATTAFAAEGSNRAPEPEPEPEPEPGLEPNGSIEEVQTMIDEASGGDALQRELRQLALQDGEKAAAEHLTKTAAKLKDQLGDDGDCELTCSLDDGIDLLAASEARWQAKHLFGMSEAEMGALGLSAADTAALSSCLRAWETENVEEAVERGDIAAFLEQIKKHGCELSGSSLAVTVGYLGGCEDFCRRIFDAFEGSCGLSDLNAAMKLPVLEFIEQVMDRFHRSGLYLSTRDLHAVCRLMSSIYHYRAALLGRIPRLNELWDDKPEAIIVLAGAQIQTEAQLLALDDEALGKLAGVGLPEDLRTKVTRKASESEPEGDEPEKGELIAAEFNEAGPIGIVWKELSVQGKDGVEMAVIKGLKPGGRAATQSKLRADLVLVSVNGTVVSGWSYVAQIQSIRESGRPITLCCRPLSSSSEPEEPEEPDDDDPFAGERTPPRTLLPRSCLTWARCCAAMDALPEGTMRYRIIRKAAVREAFALDSEQIAILEVGDTIEVHEHRRNENDQIRIRTGPIWDPPPDRESDEKVEGWTSITSRDGNKLMVPVPERGWFRGGAMAAKGEELLLGLIKWAAKGAERLDRAAFARVGALVFNLGEELTEEEWQEVCEELGADASEGLGLARLQAFDAEQWEGEIARWVAAHPRATKYDALLARGASKRERRRGMSILMVGLDIAGKSTILCQLKLGEVDTSIPPTVRSAPPARARLLARRPRLGAPR
eukprot:COSAG04_NODE_200_length_20490_cov_33.582021_2_plen_3075_part_00